MKTKLEVIFYYALNLSEDEKKPEIREAEVDTIFMELDERETKIIHRRFIGDPLTHTLEDVGQKMGVTRERIRQLQNIALAKLRRAARRLIEEKNISPTGESQTLDDPLRDLDFPCSV